MSTRAATRVPLSIGAIVIAPFCIFIVSCNSVRMAMGLVTDSSCVS